MKNITEITKIKPGLIKLTFTFDSSKSKEVDELINDFNKKLSSFNNQGE